MKPKPSDAAEAALAADAAAARTARGHEQSLLVRLLEPVADLGDQPQMRILCGAIVAVGLIAEDRRLIRTGARMFVAHSLATLAKDFVKKRVDRTRPRSIDAPGKDHRPAPGRSEAKEETSFPSGHSAGAAAVARAFARDYPEHSAPACGAAAVLALVQVPRCAHYPTDVGAGLAIGLAAEALTSLAFRAAGVD
ncbi:MAG TPA: phosphatase PAP2 family protein [Allosphingosinicella sp.]|jgi:membrane-associated phospholipid phosphatase